MKLLEAVPGELRKYLEQLPANIQKPIRLAEIIFTHCTSITLHHLPTTTVYPCGYGKLRTQWAAVTIQSGFIRDPPHMCFPLTRSETCHGHEWGAAFSPLTTRAENGRLPHSVKEKLCQNNTAKSAFRGQSRYQDKCLLKRGVSSMEVTDTKVIRAFLLFGRGPMNWGIPWIEVSQRRGGSTVYQNLERKNLVVVLPNSICCCVITAA